MSVDHHPPHRLQRHRAALRCHERRHAALRQQGRHIGRVRAHKSQNRFVAVVHAVFNRIRHQLGHRQAGRADDDDQRVIARAVQQGLNRAAQKSGLQPGQRHINRVAVQRRVVTGLQGAQPRGGGRIGRRRLKTRHAQAVRHQRARAAGGGENRHPFAAQHAPGGQGGGHVQQVAKALCPQHTHLLEQRVVHAVGPGQRASV